MSNDITNPDEMILIVDDNLQTAEFIEYLLNMSGFSCCKTATGKGALEIISSRKIDLVILDIIMPDCNGIDIAIRIKSLSNQSFLPVILVSALGSDKDKVAGLTHADDYLTKPFSGEELVARVNSLLRIRRLNIALSQSKRRYECLYENFPNFYLSIDSEREITECNKAFRGLYSACKSDTIEKSIYSFFIPEDVPVLESFFFQLEQTQQSSVHARTFSLIVPKTSQPLLVKMNAVYMGDTETGLSIVIAMEDVTRQFHLQEEQKIARKQLYRSARLASIGTLASGVAHEINNPLTAILGFSSALLDRVENDEKIDDSELNQYLKIINVEALRCRDIVENLSRFASEADVSHSIILLNKCISDAINLVRSKASRVNISISNKLVETVGVCADSNKVEQVFINILSNAIEFSPPGSAVIIEPNVSHDPQRVFSLNVIDNGPGISHEIISKVFDPFFTTKEVGKGTGMGLAICHKIMEECNGSIDITSDNSDGTVVTLNFPLAPKDVSETEIA